MALLLAACAGPRHTLQPTIELCDVEIVFGSYAMGVDQALKASILRTVRSNADVAEWSEVRWGREGESTVCVHSPNESAADRLYDRIAVQIPTYSDRAPTSVVHIDGRRKEATLPHAP
ncbi:MAG: hypothetical protein ACOH1E_06955 [Brevundimonas sp.]